MNNNLLKIFSGVAYVGMVVVNFLANSLPINNRSTGVISDAYPNLFAPAGPAFSIWGIIYLLLGCYIVYQFVSKDKKINEVFRSINSLFIATSLANIAWIFAWHYDHLGISVLIMTILLLLLIKISQKLKSIQLAFAEKLCISLPFSLYFGWITVAIIANITVFLVSTPWNGFGISDVMWTSIILLIGASIGAWRTYQDKNIAYGLVLVWAYFWILVKHISSSGFDGAYTSVMVTAVISIGFLVFWIGNIVQRKA